LIFTPARLTLARERRGLTNQALADRCGVTRRTVTAWESGQVEDPPVELLAQVLDFPVEFFYAGDPPEISKELVSFRALSSVTAGQVHKVLASAALAREFADWIDGRYSTPKPDVPNLADLLPVESDAQPHPVEAADHLRAMWGLGVGPIKNMLALLESRGVRVFSLPSGDREVDAFSFWHGGQPFVFLNLGKSAEHVRFDLAHELGHLCMHRTARNRANRDRAYEIAANRFASAFLMPANGLYPQLSGRPTLGDVMTLKRRWRVSATAMVRRMYDLGCISGWHYRTWMIELAQAGYRSAEPDGLPHEGSILLRKLMTLAKQDRWTVPRIAAHLKVNPAELEVMLVGLVMSTIEGGGAKTETPGGHLRLVN
jgi:Zn-dependent peptidase ImmA (M78 family)/DNA-binding XRE family transcriptional regulator